MAWGYVAKMITISADFSRILSVRRFHPSIFLLILSTHLSSTHSSNQLWGSKKDVQQYY